MAIVVLPFSFNPSSTGVQVGDIAYYISEINLPVTGGHQHASSLDNVVKLGAITEVSSTQIKVNVTSNVDLPQDDDYIFFTKDNAVNLKSLIGYFASIKFKNDSTEYAELFNVGVGVVESSK